MFGVWPLTASKTHKRNFFSFLSKFNLTNELYIAPGPQKGILLGGSLEARWPPMEATIFNEIIPYMMYIFEPLRTCTMQQ